MPRVLGGSEGGERFLIGEAPLYVERSMELTGCGALYTQPGRCGGVSSVKRVALNLQVGAARYCCSTQRCFKLKLLPYEKTHVGLIT